MMLFDGGFGLGSVKLKAKSELQIYDLQKTASEKSPCDRQTDTKP